ncbi:MAG: CocE/NonD family hydrolase [Caulobacteraceae bacterium]
MLSLPGDPARPVMLQATLYLPPGPGPFPLAVVNHGSDGKPRDNPRYRGNFQAWYFVSRGYAVVMPMMRGFAGSGGELELDGCDLARMGLADARDLQAVIDDMAQRPEIDASRIVMSGQSFGGWNTLAYGAVADPRVKALVNFAGGVATSVCPDTDRPMARGTERFGKTTRIPSLWFYGDNDHLFAPKVWRAGFTKYAAAGGPAELVAYGVFGEDSHNFLGSGAALPIWTPKVDALLGRVGLPSRVLYPEYLPLAPAPTNYAAIDDVAAVPFLNDAGRALYAAFLKKPLPRAFIISPREVDSEREGFDPVARGLAVCGKVSPLCEVYAFDDSVVWAGPPEGKTLVHDRVPIVSKSARAGAAIVILTVTGLKADCTPDVPPVVRIAQPPAHGALEIVQRQVFPAFAAPSPLAACNRAKTAALVSRYTPATGFAGVDFMTLGITAGAQPEKLFKAAVTVR